MGPGTVLTCASAGIDFGYQLAWVLVFATAAAFVLQSFTAAMGILSRQGLAEAVRSADGGPLFTLISRILIVAGLWIGCASFELGNLSGAAAGLSIVAGNQVELRWYVLILATVCVALLQLPVRILINVLSGMVASMGLLFLAAAMMSDVDWAQALQGMLVPRIPDGGIVRVLALIGTTVVTYNLFLHASATREFWSEQTDVRQAWRHELTGMAIFIPLGGLVSLAILWCGAAVSASSEKVTAVADMAGLMEPVAGRAAGCLFGLGLFAAGLTSAITAPLAAAAGISELFGWQKEGRKYQAVWISVLLTGVVFSLFGWSPLNVIIAAQAANGLLLPLVAGFMLLVISRLNTVQLPRWFFGLGIVITLLCAALGVRTLVWVAEKLGFA